MKPAEIGYHLSTDFLPLIYMCQVGRDEEKFPPLLAKLSEVVQRDMPHLLVWDARGVPVATPTQRTQAGEFIKKHEHISKRRCIACIFLVDSKLLRVTVTATMWLSEPPFPIEVLNTNDELAKSLKRYVDQKKLSADLVEKFLQKVA